MTRATPEYIQRVAQMYTAAVKAGDSTTATDFARAHGISHATLYKALAKLEPLTPGTRRGRSYKVADAPPLAELEDACARWGFDGAAEEYEVTEERVREWLRAYGELSEGKAR